MQVLHELMSLLNFCKAKKKDTPTAEFFSEVSKRQRNPIENFKTQSVRGEITVLGNEKSTAYNFVGFMKFFLDSEKTAFYHPGELLSGLSYVIFIHIIVWELLPQKCPI